MLSSLYLTPSGALQQNLGEEELRAAVRSNAGLLWVNFFQPTPEEFFMLDEIFGFHPLAIEDCQHTSQYPKMDEFGNHIFLVILAPNPNCRPGLAETENGEDPVNELDIFLGAHYVVTCHVKPLSFLQGLFERAKRDTQNVLGRGASHLLHDLMDLAVDQLFGVIERLNDEAEEAELELSRTEKLELLTGMLELKRRVLNLRRTMSDHREVIQRLIRGDLKVVAPKAHPYFRDLLDHLNRIEHDLDVCRDTIDHAREVYLALMDARANQIMKVLTILFTVSLPFTVVTGWYGMNFTHLPMLEEPWAPWAASAGMLLVAGIILLALHRKKWL